MSLENREHLQIITKTIKDSFSDESIEEGAQKALEQAQEEGENPSDDYVEGVKSGMEIASKSVIFSLEIIDAFWAAMEGEEDE